jgi:hypothetical protein
MSVISSNAKTRTPAAREASEFDGIWLNAGVSMGTEDESTFVRLPRGIAVSDLKPRKVYENMDPVFAAQVTMMNKMIAAIQAKGATLAEGESTPINLEMVIYRKQEDVAPVADDTGTADIEAALFG